MLKPFDRTPGEIFTWRQQKRIYWQKVIDRGLIQIFVTNNWWASKHYEEDVEDSINGGDTVKINVSHASKCQCTEPQSRFPSKVFRFKYFGFTLTFWLTLTSWPLSLKRGLCLRGSFWNERSPFCILFHSRDRRVALSGQVMRLKTW